MALTQIQKKILDTLVYSPDEILVDIKNDKIKLDSFKNQFYQDGRGFTHILLENYSYYPNKFEPLLKHVLLNSSLSFEENKGRTSSALSNLMNHEKDKKISATNLKALAFMFTYIGDKLTDYTFSRGMNILCTEKYNELFNHLLDNKTTIKYDYHWASTIEQLIIQDDFTALKKLISKFDKFEPEYSQVYSLKSDVYQRPEQSNLLILAIAHSKEITNFFLETYDFDLSGKVKNKYHQYGMYSYHNRSTNVQPVSVSALEQSYYSKNIELFDKFLNKENSLEELNVNLLIKRVKSNKNTLLDIILDTPDEFYPLIKEKILNTNSFANNKTLHCILSSNLNLTEKLQLTEHIVPKIKEGQLNKNYLLNSFFSNTYQQGIKDIETIGKIFSMVYNNDETREFIELEIFKLPLINNPNLLQNLIANGYDLSKNGDKKINPFYHYFKNTDKLTGNDLSNFFKGIDIKLSQKTFNIIKLIYPEEILLDNGNANILQKALSVLDVNFINNLSDKEFSILKEKENLLNSMNNPKENMRELYTQTCKTLYEHDVSFFSKGKNFYNIFTFVTDYHLIDDILKKENTSVSQLSQDDIFWNYINHSEIANYVQSRGALYNSTDITKQLMFSDDEVFNLYIEKGGTPFIKENSNNILHLLIKEGMYSKANCVLKKYPELSQEINDQKKIPLLYLLNDFNKLCKENHMRSDFNWSSKFKDGLELFNNYMSYGNIGKNPKTKKILTDQLEKYTDIKKVIPDLDTIILYKSIESNTEKKNTTIKKVKI